LVRRATAARPKFLDSGIKEQLGGGELLYRPIVQTPGERRQRKRGAKSAFVRHVVIIPLQPRGVFVLLRFVLLRQLLSCSPFISHQCRLSHARWSLCGHSPAASERTCGGGLRVDVEDRERFF
jgi:hypothetical protein